MDNTQHLRRCFSCFGTGVTVVTFSAPEGPRGITVNSFTSVSLQPPLILVSISKTARSHSLLIDRPFAVNVLGPHQEAIARQFAGYPQPELDIPWGSGELAPILRHSLAVIECRPWRHYDGGDHTLFLGEVIYFAYRSGDGLGFFKGRFIRLSETSEALSPRTFDPFEMPYDSA